MNGIVSKHAQNASPTMYDCGRSWLARSASVVPNRSPIANKAKAHDRTALVQPIAAGMGLRCTQASSAQRTKIQAGSEYKG